MVRHQLALNEIVMKLPWVDSFNSTPGGGSSSGSQSSNQGRIFIHMVARDQRRSATEMVQQIRSQLAVVPAIDAYPRLLPTICTVGQQTNNTYQFTPHDTVTK